MKYCLSPAIVGKRIVFISFYSKNMFIPTFMGRSGIMRTTRVTNCSVRASGHSKQHSAHPVLRFHLNSWSIYICKSVHMSLNNKLIYSINRAFSACFSHSLRNNPDPGVALGVFQWVVYLGLFNREIVRLKRCIACLLIHGEAPLFVFVYN